ncbi:two-component system response regulator NarL [Marinicellulosiphila megalodicopiae]|uniref:two-component system response regulator NarL n=1 Tax=Marinicellulosiphila megalodicopiae TaxID=2724896 RepID=UPI003BB09088
MSEKSTIITIDDHPLLRKGLKQLVEFEEEIEIIAEASNGADGIKLALELEPDLIILDLNMQNMDGIETLKILREKGVQSRVVMLTVSDNDDDVVRAVQAGADGYLLKDTDPEDLLEKIKEATMGKMVINDRLTQILATALKAPLHKTENKLSTLTNREKEILELIAKGLPNKLIARELDISDGTVKVHVKHLLKKLELRSRVEAAVWFLGQ